MTQAAIPVRRKCAHCGTRIVSARDLNDPKKTFTEPVARPHCNSAVCDWCNRCYAMKLAECKRTVT